MGDAEISSIADSILKMLTDQQKEEFISSKFLRINKCILCTHQLPREASIKTQLMHLLNPRILEHTQWQIQLYSFFRSMEIDVMLPFLEHDLEKIMRPHYSLQVDQKTGAYSTTCNYCREVIHIALTSEPDLKRILHHMWIKSDEHRAVVDQILTLFTQRRQRQKRQKDRSSQTRTTNKQQQYQSWFA